MEHYILEEFYLYDGAPGGKGELTGELELATDGSFESALYDHGSRTPEQVIRGHLRRHDDTERLAFLKFPPSADLANLGYDLRKESNGSFEGTYGGMWGALPVKVLYSPEYDVFMARIDMRMCRIGDAAEIRLRRKRRILAPSSG